MDVTTPSGKISYLFAGQGDPVVMLHGLVAAADCWEKTMKELAGQYSVFALDALNNGRSEQIAEADTSLEGHARRVAEFMDAVGISSADIVGTSHGGAVAMCFASLYPERVRHLILHAPANPFSDLADSLIQFYGTRLGTWFAHQIPQLPRRVQDLALGRMYGNPNSVQEGVLEKYMNNLRRPGTIGHLLQILRGWSSDMKRLESRLPKIRNTPALLLWGTRDRVVSLKSGLILEKHFDNVVMTLLPQTGHIPYEECPHILAREIMSYLDEQAINRSKLAVTAA